MEDDGVTFLQHRAVTGQLTSAARTVSLIKWTLAQTEIEIGTAEIFVPEEDRLWWSAGRAHLLYLHLQPCYVFAILANFKFIFKDSERRFVDSISDITHTKSLEICLLPHPPETEKKIIVSNDEFKISKKRKKSHRIVTQ